MSHQLPPSTPRTRFAGVRDRLERLEFRSPITAGAYEFLLFGFKQGWACLFGGLVLALLIATHLWWPNDAPIHRYDALTIACALIQLAMLAFRLETWGEARVILAFHIVGTLMEIFKTAMGSWAYPESALLQVGGVPLFSGFMYAAVGSYIARIWRIFDFSLPGSPPAWQPVALAAAIYVNFFTHHFGPDLRLALFAATAFIWRRTWVEFTVWRERRRMPLLVGLLLVALFIWFAENIGTFTRTWAYPGQERVWTMVPLAKLGAWYLLMIISFVLVLRLHGERAKRPAEAIP